MMFSDEGAFRARAAIRQDLLHVAFAGSGGSVCLVSCKSGLHKFGAPGHHSN
jgi:hypothetical protein